MYSPSAYELLAVWERGLALGPIQRGLLLLTTIFPELSELELAQFSIGKRDSYLMTLREQLFGATVASIAACPVCSEPLELNFALADLRVPGDWQTTHPREIEVHAGGYAIRCRVPNQGDLLAIGGSDPGAARQVLLQRCILAIEAKSVSDPAQTLDQLSDAVTAAVVEHIAEADPQGEIQIALVCPMCRHEWLAQFDILSFLWGEITDWAQRALREVHTLASAYGWHEVEILSMSAWRRQLYLQMVST